MDHLFISYAIEDAPLARWLTLKLTIEGYKVWCFEFEMLGGKSFPKEIDAAIKTQTFRMLGIVSRHSIKKANPVKEWTLAQALGAERKVDFLVPLNVDGVRPTELPWTLADTNWIPFYSAGWAGGFKQLLKLLEKLQAPKSVVNGAVISARAFIPEGIESATPETLFSNCVGFKVIPSHIGEYRFTRERTNEEWKKLCAAWAFWRVNDDCVLAFTAPPDSAPTDLVEKTGRGWDWATTEVIEGVRAHDLISSLLYRSVIVVLVAGGCVFGEKSHALYFPAGLFPKDKIKFTDYTGRKTHVATKGKSTFYRRGEAQLCTYYLGFRHTVTRTPDGQWVVYFKIYLRITDTRDHELEPRPAHTRRKAITRGWWNDKLLNRYLALCEAIRGFQDLRRFRESPAQVLLAPMLITFAAPGGLDETCFEKTVVADESADDGSKVSAVLLPSDDDGEEEDDEI